MPFIEELKGTPLVIVLGLVRVTGGWSGAVHVRDGAARMPDCAAGVVALQEENPRNVDFKTKDFYVANVGVSSAMEASSTCEDGFKEKEGAVSPLKKDRDFFQLNAIALAIINMFQ
ncbi:hypothetical protein HHK36_032322 [Tetracentron sinense]|uniref:Pectinesterase inhibitor domain-containing protein n=1 Tax=Tetracentron sinense TaxID=13715 RepID=A0A835CXA6_TETSI|nr:hypothetical protein HHK36_032322 [Tetracentron sinense]